MSPELTDGQRVASKPNSRRYVINRAFAQAGRISRGHAECRSATYFADGTGDPTLIAKTWQMMDECWLKSLALFDPPIEQVSIPYQGTMLRGFYFPRQKQQGQASYS